MPMNSLLHALFPAVSLCHQRRMCINQQLYRVHLVHREQRMMVRLLFKQFNLDD